MNDQMESTGKTVDEAIREALLRMGLRREEVDVTVVQEARSGLFGLGSRQAVVKVSKKSGRSRDARGRRDERGEASGGGRGRQRGERLDAGRDDGGDRRRGGRGRGARVEKQVAAGRGDQRRGVRGGRDRRVEARPDEAATTSGKESQDTRQNEAPQPESRRADRRDDQQAEGQEGGRMRRRRPRRRRKRSDAEAPSAAAPVTPKSAAPDGTDGPAAPVPQAEQDSQVEQGGPAAERDRQVEQTASVAADVPRADDRPTRHQDRDTTPAPEADLRPDPNAAPDHAEAEGAVLIGDLTASQQVQPVAVAEAGETTDLLQRVTTDLMLKSGFASRVQVQPGEYHLVKMVVDDRSAAVLIGRYGNTVDAVEHLVEKIASKAVGERVRMNLDINNYRARREDALVQRARNAAAEVRNTGQPVTLDPAGGRERRIVHLYIQDTGDLTTYTEDGPDGKFVVVCQPDQVPAEYRDHPDDGSATTAPEIEVNAVIDVDTDSREQRAPVEERSGD